MDAGWKSLLSEVIRTPVVDTHEHLPPFEDGREKETDFLREYLSHYMSSDLMSSGLPPVLLEKAQDHGIPLLDRWRLVEPYWEHCRYTGFGQALDRSVSTIYGIDGIRASTVQELDRAFSKTLLPGSNHFRRVLKDLCGIEVCLLNPFVESSDCDREFFRPVWPFDRYVRPGTGEAVSLANGGQIQNLDDWIAALEQEIEDRLGVGIVALKCILAYERPLMFEKVAYDDAKADFAKALQGWENAGRGAADAVGFSTRLEDFMLRHTLGVAARRGIPVQFHTGMLAVPTGTLSGSDPLLMEQLFYDFPSVTFDLFHIGYPFYGRAAALAKIYPNVYLDMCWAHIISPWAARQALSDFLDAVPYNKISAFGGDYGFPDAICGHLRMAQENVSRVLWDRVVDGTFTETKALDISRAFFHDNPIRIFHLS